MLCTIIQCTSVISSYEQSFFTFLLDIIYICMHTVYGYLATTETRHQAIRHHNFIKRPQRSRHKNEQLLMANWLLAKRPGREVNLYSALCFERLFSGHSYSHLHLGSLGLASCKRSLNYQQSRYWEVATVRDRKADICVPFQALALRGLFNYRIPAENVIPPRVHPRFCAGEVISFRYKVSQQHHINVEPLVSVWKKPPGGLKRVERA